MVTALYTKSQYAMGTRPSSSVVTEPSDVDNPAWNIVVLGIYLFCFYSLHSFGFSWFGVFLRFLFLVGFVGMCGDVWGCGVSLALTSAALDLIARVLILIGIWPYFTFLKLWKVLSLEIVTKCFSFNGGVFGIPGLMWVCLYSYMRISNKTLGAYETSSPWAQPGYLTENIKKNYR